MPDARPFLAHPLLEDQFSSTEAEEIANDISDNITDRKSISLELRTIIRSEIIAAFGYEAAEE